MKANSPSPILIVGAGPVGLTAAHRMARHGVPIRIIDGNRTTTTASKALIVWRRTLQILDSSIGYERFLGAGHEARRMRMSADGKRLGEIDLTNTDHELPTGVFIPQSQTERLLLEALAEQGHEVNWQTRLIDFTQDTDGVTCQLEGPDGPETFRCSWLIGCDGAHSTVRHHLGIAFAGESMDRRFILADVSVDVETNPHEGILSAGASGMTALFPVDKSRWRIIADKGPVDPNADSANPTTEELQAVLDTPETRDWKIAEVFWSGEFHINERQVENYVHDRILLAGDAAHVHSPAGGQGMNTGIQDATNLAWKVALVWKEAAPPALLETYQEERHPVGRQVVQVTSRMTRAVTIDNPLVRYLRDAVIHLGLEIPSLRRQIADFMSEETINFRKSRLSGPGIKGAAVQPGDAFPDIALPGPDGPISATHLLRDAEVVCLIFGTIDTSELPYWLGKEECGFPVTHRRVEDQVGMSGGQALSACFGLNDGGFVLIRPDGVVTAVGKKGLDWWGGGEKMRLFV